MADAGGVGEACGNLAGVATRVDGLAGKVCADTLGIRRNGPVAVTNGARVFVGGRRGGGKTGAHDPEKSWSETGKGGVFPRGDRSRVDARLGPDLRKEREGRSRVQQFRVQWVGEIREP